MLLLHTQIGTVLHHPGAIGAIGEFAAEDRQVVLRAGVLDAGQELAALAHEVQPPTDQIARGPHGRGVDIRLRQHASTRQDGDLVGVNPVVLGLAPVDGLHRQRVAEHERDAFGRADVGHPVPREHALDRHHQAVAVGRHDLEERRRGGRYIAVHQHLAGAVEDGDLHRLHVQINPAVVRVLSVVESRRSSSCATCAFALRQTTHSSRSRGRAV